MLDIETGQIVKICGLKSEDAARTASLAGADLLGFILAESRRQVSPSLVRKVRQTISDEMDGPPAVVGVMVNPDASDVLNAVRDGDLDIVQLSGDESPELLDEIDVPVIKTVHVAAEMRIEDVQRKIEPWLDHQRPAVAIHIDAKVEGLYGGTGMQSDWDVATLIAERYPALLAGGLNPGNVFDGIQVVGPRGVDVSSGVEIAGEKDHALIEAFIAHARQSFASRAAESPGSFAD